MVLPHYQSGREQLRGSNKISQIASVLTSISLTKDFRSYFFNYILCFILLLLIAALICSGGNVLKFFMFIDHT